MPGGFLHPFGGFDVESLRKPEGPTTLRQPERLQPTHVDELKRFARMWIERVTEDPDRDQLEKSLDSAPEGWPHHDR